MTIVRPAGATFFLRASVQKAEFRDVDRAAQNTGGNVRDERHAAGIGQLLEHGAVDRVVHADVEVVRVGAELIFVERRDAAEVVVLRGGDGLAVAEAAGLLVGLRRKLAGEHVVGLAALRHQVERDHRELRGSAALQEENLIVIGNLHHLAQKLLRALDDAVVDLRSVRHLHDGLSAALVIEHFRRSFSEDALRQHRGAG